MSIIIIIVSSFGLYVTVVFKPFHLSATLLYQNIFNIPVIIETLNNYLTLTFFYSLMWHQSVLGGIPY